MRDDALAAGSSGAEIPVLRMTAFVLASVYGGRRRGAVRRAHPLHRARRRSASRTCSCCWPWSSSAAGRVAGRLRDRRHRAHHRPAGADRLAAYAQLGYGLLVVLVVGVRADRPGRDPVPGRRVARSARRVRGDAGAVPAARAGAPAGLASADVLLEVSGLGKRFRGLTAVDASRLRSSAARSSAWSGRTVRARPRCST